LILVQMAILKFENFLKAPDGFRPCLVQRDLEVSLRINGSLHHGIKERRSEYVISYFTGSHWLGREEHWSYWAEIPAEGSEHWNHAGGFIPESLKPVLCILPQPYRLMSMTIPAGLHFALYDERYDDPTWRIYVRNEAARMKDGIGENALSRQWLGVGRRAISSWLQLPPLNTNLRHE
jgi:hypothetical protein